MIDPAKIAPSTEKSFYRVWTTGDIDGAHFRGFILLDELSAEDYAQVDASMVSVKTMVELIAVVQKLLEDRTAFEDVVAGVSGPHLMEPARAALLRRIVEDHIIWMSIFANSITTYLKRLDPEAGQRFFGDQLAASKGVSPLGLVRIMRNYIEHFCTLPVRFPLCPEAGVDEWKMVLKVEEVVAAADEEGFRLKDPLKRALQALGDVDVLRTCEQAFEALDRSVGSLPMRRALEEKVLPACDALERFLEGYEPEGTTLYISGPDADEPKRSIAIGRYHIDAIRQLYHDSPNADRG